MKLGYNRETIIGLSVLLVLTIILGVVVVRRFMRHDAPLEVAVLRAEERAEEKGHDEHRLREMEAEKPILALPEAMPGQDGGHAHGDPAQWEAHAKEHHEEKAEREHESSAIAIVPPPSPAAEKHEHHEEALRERKAIEHSEPPPGAEDRYAVPSAPLPDHVDAGAGRAMVVQVSGDGPDGPPRHLDGHEHERRDELRENHAILDGARDHADQRTYSDADAQRRPEANPFDNRRTRAMETAGENGPGTSYAARDPRSGWDSAAAAPPIDNGQQGYPGPAAGFRENEHRHDEMRAQFPQRPLRNDGLYEVQPNDSYWTISERVYGSGGYFRALAEVNRGKAARPDKLSPGLLVSTPPAAQLEKDYPDFCPRPARRETIRDRAAAAASLTAYAGGGRTYVVQEGDTLSSIARIELGKVSRWAEIYQLNREALGKDYDYLTPGQRLVLPSRDSPSTDRTTRRGDSAPPLTR